MITWVINMTFQGEKKKKVINFLGAIPTALNKLKINPAREVIKTSLYLYLPP